MPGFSKPSQTFTAVDQMMMMEEGMIECIPEIAKSAEFFRVCVPAWRWKLQTLMPEKGCIDSNS